MPSLEPEFFIEDDEAAAAADVVFVVEGDFFGVLFKSFCMSFTDLYVGEFVVDPDFMCFGLPGSFGP